MFLMRSAVYTWRFLWTSQQLLISDSLTCAWLSHSQSWEFELLGNLQTPKPHCSLCDCAQEWELSWSCSQTAGHLRATAQVAYTTSSGVSKLYLHLLYLVTVNGKEECLIPNLHLMQISVTHVSRVIALYAGPCCVLLLKCIFLFIKCQGSHRPKVLLHITKSMFYSCINNVLHNLI